MANATAPAWRSPSGALRGALSAVIKGKELANEPAGERVRLRTLVLARWLAVFGQTSAILLIKFVFGFSLPLLTCFAVIATSVLFNAVQQFRNPFTKLLSVPEATFHAGFDIVQIAALLALTGGLQNPFTLLLLAPITVSASMLGLKPTVILGGLGFILISLLTVFHEPLPWKDGAPLKLEPIYVAGIWVAMSFGIVFNSAYAWWVSREAGRMRTALTATQQVLSREQRLAALGGLAAAAAHELGTPLATIALVAKEMSRDIDDGHPHADDVRLLRDQADRCRDILSRLSRQPGDDDAVVTALPLKALLEAIAAPHDDMGVSVSVSVDEIEGSGGLRVSRRPEIDYGIGNLIENAVDFASARVKVHGHSGPEFVSVRVTDDGPGFAPEVLDRIGEPYVTTRPRPKPLEGGQHDADEQHGMGLGFFIAKTLLERTGAVLTIANRPGGREPGERGGAEVTVTWPRERLQVQGQEPMPTYDQ